jgi:hypothetical protein
MMPSERLHPCSAFEFAPTAFAIRSAQSSDVANGITSRNQLDFNDFANDIRLHTENTITGSTKIQARRNPA